MKTRLIDWSRVVGYSKSEFDSAKLGPNGNWDMHPELMRVMQNYRSEMKHKYQTVSVNITPDGGFCLDGHSSRSLHKPVVHNDYMNFATPNGVVHWKGPIGRACDSFVLYGTERRSLTPVEMAVELYHTEGVDKRVGIGVYPFNGFIHTDWREGVEDRTDAVWWRDESGEYHFHPFNDFYGMLDEINLVLGEVEDLPGDEAPSEEAKDESDESDKADELPWQFP